MDSDSFKTSQEAHEFAAKLNAEGIATHISHHERWDFWVVWRV